MRVHTLELQNFRCFEHLELDLDTDLVVLVGINGAGKTAVLDSLAALLAAWGGATMSHMGSAGSCGANFHGTDVRRLSTGSGATDMVPVAEARVRADVTLGGEVTWLGEIFLPSGHKGGSEGLRAAWHASYELVELLRAGQTVTLPVHAAYSTRRGTVGEGRGSKVTGRADGYDGSMSAQADIKAVREWLSEVTAIELQEGRSVPERGAVEQAVAECLHPSAAFRYLFRQRELQLTFGGNTLPLSFFSDGVRSIVALVADLAWRCAVLNPHLGSEAVRQTPGVALIDEIDLHLHPEWQWRVLDDLRRAFPKIQFIVTTHSPQVIASVGAECLRLLNPGGRIDRVSHSKGWDANSVLRGIMGSDWRSAATRADLEQLAALLDSGYLHGARDRLSRLRDLVGPQDPEVLQAEWSIRLAEVEEGQAVSP